MSIVQLPSRLDLGSPKMVRLVLGLKVGRSVWTSFITLVCQIHWKVPQSYGFVRAFVEDLWVGYTNYNEHASWSDFKDSKCLRGLQEEQSFGVQGRCLLYWLLLLYWSRIGGCRPYWPYWLYWRVLKGCRAVLRCIGCMGGYWCVYIKVYWGKPPISAAASVSPDWCRTGHRLYIYTNTQIQISRPRQRLSWGTWN